MKNILVIVVLMAANTLVTAQNLSNRGKEFWVGYGHHQFMEPGQSNSQEMVLYFSAEQAAHVTVSINGTSYIRNYTIPANTVIASDLIPKNGTDDCRLFSVPPSFGGTGGEGVFERGIHIVSDVPIVAYAHIYGSASSGATMLMPVETWGYSYATINSQQRFGNNNCFSWVYVVAKEDNTVIEITPSEKTRNGRLPDVPFTVTLNKGQIYQVIGAAISSSTGFELTGSKVKSIANAAGECYPIGVFAGSSRTYITCSGTGGNGGDNIMQQIFPFQAWGKRYLTAPTSSAINATSYQTNIFRVAVKDRTAVVKKNGIQLTGLKDNFYYEYQSNTADYIESDKPILVAQYMSSNGGCPNTSGDGDPEMMYISPIEQAIKRIGFYRNTEENIEVNYLTLIIPTKGVNSLRIDNATSFLTYAHPNLAGYSVVVKRWNAAKTQCIVESDSAFTAITYGLGNVESYGYNAGTLINNLNAVSSIRNVLDSSTSQHEFTCTNTPFELSVLMAYKPTKMQWRLSELGGDITPNTDVIDNAPVSSGSVVINGIDYYKYSLPGNYTFHQTDTFTIPILATHPSIDNCNNTEKFYIEVIVKEKPKADFAFTHLGCTLDTVYFSANSTTSNNFNLVQWKWDLPASVIKSGREQKHLFPPGDHQIKLTVVSSDGCLSDTTKPIKVFDKPSAGFLSSALVGCEGIRITLTDTAINAHTNSVNSWYWNFGNNTSTSLTSNTPQSITYSVPNTYQIKHVVKSSETCVSDTVAKEIIVFPKPAAGFSYGNGCISPNEPIQFKDTSHAFGETINRWQWEFGDPASGASNTSTLQNPSHQFTKAGSYSVKLIITSQSGCISETTVQVSVKLKPILAVSPDNDICAGTNTLLIASGGSTYAWSPATGLSTATGASVLASPTTTTTYQVVGFTDGCSDTALVTLTVIPRPFKPVVIPFVNECLNAVPRPLSATAMAGHSLTWHTNFPLTAGTTTAPTPSTAIVGPTQYYITQTNGHGCVSDTSIITVSIQPLPSADFLLPAGVCLPNGEAKFLNRSTVADNSALTHLWDFGDGTPAVTSKDASHIYAATGNYSVTMTTTSAYGCVAAVSKTFSDFFEKPRASFTVNPAILCQGQENVFGDASDARGSTITKWEWLFGDGQSAREQNPRHRYNLPKTYTVKLTVTTAIGCTSDTFQKEVVVFLQPKIEAGPSFIVPEGTTVQFKASANDTTTVSLSWSPSIGLSNPTSLQPSLTVRQNQVYTLTAIGQNNCTATDNLTVRMLKQIEVPNAFSPNGDGINDFWMIPNLVDYPGAKVEVFNRWGQQIYMSYGYTKPWDGSYLGKALPLATYYYIITLNNGFKQVTGSVTIIK